MTNKKIDEIILIKIFATILVVLGHATRDLDFPNPHMFEPEFTSIMETTVKSYIYSFHMPLFFFISGFLFSINSKDKRSLSSLILKKVNRLLVPMWSGSFLILIPSIYFFGNFNNSFFHQIKMFIVGLDNDHFWFLRTLFLIFIFAIPFKYYYRGSRKNFLFVILILFLIIFIFQKCAPGLLKSVLKWTPFFIAGYFTLNFEKIISNIGYRFLCISFIILHTIFFFMGNYKISSSFELLFWYMSAFCGTYFFYFSSRYAKLIIDRYNVMFLFKIFDKYLFSIYLFHIVFVYMMLYVNSFYELGFYRIILTFFIGITIPIIFQKILSRIKILSFIFCIPYYKKNNV